MTSDGLEQIRVFRKLRHKKRSSHVVEELLRAIKSGHYTVGDKLPSEQEIAEQTGVSRPSVREALSVLRFVGILDTKIGDGTYIRALPEENGEEEFQEAKIRDILQETENPFEAMEARRALETNLVAYAAERRTNEDIADLDKALTAIIACANRDDIDSLLHADKEFHLVVARACHNSLLEQMLAWLLELLEEGMWPHIKASLLLGSKRHLEETRRSHRGIFDSIVAHDARTAVAQMQGHFDEIDRLVQEGQ